MNNTEERVLQWIEDQDELILAVEIYLDSIIKERVVDKVKYVEMLEYIGLLYDETPDGLLYWEDIYDETILDDWLNNKFNLFIEDF